MQLYGKILQGSDIGRRVCVPRSCFHPLFCNMLHATTLQDSDLRPKTYEVWLRACRTKYLGQ